MKQRVIVSFFLLATLLFLSLLLLYSTNNFIEILASKELKKNTLLLVPEFVRPLYAGFPSPIALLSYCLFTLSAFLLLKEPKGSYKSLSLISFVLLLILLVFFF
ncbi:hypothetical protein G4D82_13115 [Flavobacterium sp. CYK-4]|uniref:hypothetical protein n=1 Tax=Flavobacterium lotistagni TaxID=2709660 RepID=UPI00140E7A20|nr:hypothetical protein [Flavobacterium lotistagni]NHM08166.1 hypothetical protein [Flavobacterium lotistagni]